MFRVQSVFSFFMSICPLYTSHLRSHRYLITYLSHKLVSFFGNQTLLFNWCEIIQQNHAEILRGMLSTRLKCHKMCEHLCDFPSGTVSSTSAAGRQGSEKLHEGRWKFNVLNTLGKIQDEMTVKTFFAGVKSRTNIRIYKTLYRHSWLCTHTCRIKSMQSFIHKVFVLAYFCTMYNI